MRNDLPPLHLLATLETVVRTGSFAKAAAELHVTPSAVSGQMRELEAFLGQQLFARHARGIEILHETRSFAKHIRATLDALKVGFEGFRHTTGQRERLTVCALPALAHCWLTPRLTGFRDAQPHVDLTLEASDDPVDFTRRPDIDIAIFYTPPPPADAQAIHLMDDSLVPVCAPTLAGEFGAHAARARLPAVPLLLNSRWESDWSSWAEGDKREFDRLSGEIIFTHYSMMMQAAESGLGVAIAHLALSADLVRSGRLVLLSQSSVRAPMSFYMTIGARSRNRATVLAFKQWLLQEIKVHEDP